MAADVGTGTAVVFGTTGFTAELRGLSGTGISRGSIDTSHNGITNGYMTFMPTDLVDPGAVEMEIHFDPDEQPPSTNVAETVTVTFPLPTGKSTAATLASSAFVTDWGWEAPFEDKMVATVTVKFSGLSTWTDSAV